MSLQTLPVIVVLHLNSVDLNWHGSVSVDF